MGNSAPSLHIFTFFLLNFESLLEHVYQSCIPPFPSICIFIVHILDASLPLTNVVRIVRIKFIYVKILQDIGLPDWFFPSECQTKFSIDLAF